jgi:NAD(P)-dependent dehydrogenase (short-subunit alcohol dehydrogenase family)
MRLKNKKFLITGGAKRIGRILSLLIAREGGDVLIHHNNSVAEATSLQNEIQAIGQISEVFQSDFSLPESTNDFIREVFGSYQIDAVINNASIFSNLDWKTTKPEDWRIHQSINLEAPFLISQAFAKSMSSGKKGRIINMLDWRALKPGADHLPYTVSKAGLASLTKSLAISLAPNISVNGIALGAILPPSDGAPAADITHGLPIPRWATIRELEETVMFFLSGPEYITGEILHLDGGRHLV